MKEKLVPKNCRNRFFKFVFVEVQCLFWIENHENCFERFSKVPYIWTTDTYFRNLSHQFVAKCLIFRIKRKLAIYIKRWAGKMFRNGRKTRKKWSWEKWVTTLRSNSWCSSVNTFNMLYTIEKRVRSSIASWYFRQKLELISELQFIYNSVVSNLKVQFNFTTIISSFQIELESFNWTIQVSSFQIELYKFQIFKLNYTSFKFSNLYT